MATKTVKPGKVVRLASSRQTPTSRVCKEIDSAASAIRTDSKQLRDAIQKGKVTDAQAKLLVQTIGHETKTLQANIGNRHAEQNHVKEASRLASQERDIIGYTGPQSDLVVAAMQVVEDRDARPMRQYAKKPAA